MLSKDKKQSVIKNFAKKTGDTGSSEVQIALLTERINSLAPHFKENVKDNASHRGLIRLVNTRKKLLKYLERTDRAAYEETIKKLGLRK
ncbi:MAG: 30S ribosomal protein S15 [Rickettsiales bacterium]|jgi:small subunit ribosomal protein S15|nr:30S ribosomal protein S15 [Rickettsiales bacterium]